MSGKWWSRWLAVPLAFVAIGLVLGRFQPGAEAGGRTSPPKTGACAGSVPLGAPGAIDQSAIAAGRGAWWRLTESIDANGELVGRTLFAGNGPKTTLSMSLGTESMARGPVAGLLLVANDDGRTSELRLVAIADGCSWLVHRDANVVRSAILDARGAIAYAHVVQRETRADLGVFRLAGGDPDVALERVLEPLAPQADLGPIWATELRLNGDGSALAVQSCSDHGCRTRVLSPGAFGKPVAVVGGKDQGSIIGFAGERLVTWAFCSGMPCAIQSWAGGAATGTTIADRAIGAGLTGDGRYLVYVIDASGRAVRVDLVTSTTAEIRGVAAGELPVLASVTAAAGLDVAADEIALASSGSNAHALAPGAAVVVP